MVRCWLVGWLVDGQLDGLLSDKVDSDGWLGARWSWMVRLIGGERGWLEVASWMFKWWLVG
eukprot:7483920-Pyramimonas_sp.AAC.1